MKVRDLLIQLLQSGASLDTELILFSTGLDDGDVYTMQHDLMHVSMNGNALQLLMFDTGEYEVE